jgi:two-component system, response regulator PdtaR
MAPQRSHVQTPLGSLICLLQRENALRRNSSMTVSFWPASICNLYSKKQVKAVTTASAVEAIAVLEHRDDVQLVITDVNLPGNGLDLAAAVKARWPAINIVIATGYGAPGSDQIPAGSLFVPKPYNAQKIDRCSVSFPIERSGCLVALSSRTRHRLRSSHLASTPIVHHPNLTADRAPFLRPCDQAFV